VSSTNDSRTKQAGPGILRPLSPFESRLADIADTWFPEAFASGNFDPARLYEIAAQGKVGIQPYFGLTWPEKAGAAAVLSEPARGALLVDSTMSQNTDTARQCVTKAY